MPESVSPEAQDPEESLAEQSAAIAGRRGLKYNFFFVKIN